ncbi:MAG: fumarylacetoacetate hydrolase family protein [Cyclobacteriaceae bacterium]|nr:fumarylacetoacetate hydrolase family protein [Cyclobacteriaceae bacterium]
MAKRAVKNRRFSMMASDEIVPPFSKDWNHSFFYNQGLKKLTDISEIEIEKLPEVHEKERWASCIARPSTIFCIGLNYADHAKEAGMELPREPILFSKAASAFAGPYDDVVIPRSATKVDYEVELAVVLNENVYEAESIEQANRAIAGYCLANDISERAFQTERGGQWMKGKSSPGFCPTGPFLATTDEVPDANNLGMILKVNGEIRQNGSTSTMIFTPGFIIHYLSQFMRLEAGDIILTGTPPGVGMGMKPPQYLKAGDVVELSIDGLGRQETVFISRK